jgi:hypothetical protein
VDRQPGIIRQIRTPAVGYQADGLDNKGRNS